MDSQYDERRIEHAFRCADACAGLNPAGIPFLIKEVEKVVGVMRAALGTYDDPTNILPSLEVALAKVYDVGVTKE